MDNSFNPIPANENINPFLHADTALTVLYRQRREVLAIDADLYSFEQWKERERVLERLDESIRLCLSMY